MRIRKKDPRQLAKDTGAHLVTVHAWLAGKNFPRGPQLLALCKALRCSIDELVGTAKTKRNPVYRFAPELFAAVTSSGDMGSDDIHSVATVVRKLNKNKTCKTEVWLREIAEIVYSIEIMTGAKKPPAHKVEQCIQLSLFTEVLDTGES